MTDLFGTLLANNATDLQKVNIYRSITSEDLAQYANGLDFPYTFDITASSLQF